MKPTYKKEAPVVTPGLFTATNSTSSNSTTNANSPLARAKELIRIPDAWQRLNLPGAAGKSCKSPFRDERTPSFSVYDGGHHFKDFATGDKGDVVDFVARATGKSPGDACRLLIAWAGTGSTGTAPTPTLAARAPRAPVVPFTQPRRLPPLDKPTLKDVLALQELRKLPVSAGIEIAITRGLLFMANVYDHADGQNHRSWVVTDSARVNAQARRLDGIQWTTSNGGRMKAKTLPTMHASWPIGATDCANAHGLLLTEGPPDMLAAITVAWHIRDGDIADLGFACVAGAANALHPDSLAHFAGKHVRIVYDQDKSGRDAVKKWSKQLYDAGASVDWFNLEGIAAPDGRLVKDLNDACYYHKDDGVTEPSFPDGLADILTGLSDATKTEVAA